MARAGHRSTASRTSSRSASAGSGTRTTTRPSSPESKMSGAVRTHCPAPMQRSVSAWMRTDMLMSPGDGQLVQAEDRAVVLERQVLDRPRQPQRGYAVEQRAVGDVEFGAGEVLAQALVDAVPEGDVVAGAAADVELVGIGEDPLVAVGR